MMVEEVFNVELIAPPHLAKLLLKVLKPTVKLTASELMTLESLVKMSLNSVNVVVIAPPLPVIAQFLSKIVLLTKKCP